MGGVRNVCLVRGRQAGGTMEPIYVSPPNCWTIVKSVAIGLDAAVVEDLYLFAEAAAGGGLVPIAEMKTSATGVVFVQLWSVLNPGDGLRIRVGPTLTSFWVSGAVLPASP